MRYFPAILAGFVLIFCHNTVNAGLFTQTSGPLPELDNGSFVTAPFDFTFTGLDPAANSASTFTLDLSFENLDLDLSSEFLATLFDPSGDPYNLAAFNVFTFTTTDTINSSGTSQIVVNFSDVGGISSFNSVDPLVIRLTPSPGVNPFGPSGNPFGNPDGEASLTLS